MTDSRDTRMRRWKADLGTGKAGVSRVYPEEAGSTQLLSACPLPELTFDL